LAAALLVATGSMLATQAPDFDVTPLRISQAKVDSSKKLLTIRGFNLGAQDVRVMMNGMMLPVVSRHPAQIVVSVMEAPLSGNLIVQVSRGSKKALYKIDVGTSYAGLTASASTR
jgi:hypothetical protein